MHDKIQKMCGNDDEADEYIYKFLFGHELKKTVSLWGE